MNFCVEAIDVMATGRELIEGDQNGETKMADARRSSSQWYVALHAGLGSQTWFHILVLHLTIYKTLTTSPELSKPWCPHL